MSTPVLPEVLPLKPLEPVIGVENNFTYPLLDAAVSEYLGREALMWSVFSDSDTGSIEEQEAARKLAMTYLLATSASIQRKGRSAADQEQLEILSERFTLASQELYDTDLDRGAWMNVFTEHVQGLESSPSPAAHELLNRYGLLGYVPGESLESDSDQLPPWYLPRLL